MASIFTGSIDITKITKDKLNDGKYLQVSVVVNDEIGTYGHSGYISEGQTKEERENKVEKNFIGNVKCVWTNGINVGLAPKKKEDLVTTATSIDEDLPF